MPTTTLFTIFNTGVLLPWLLLLVAPRWKATQQMVHTQWPVLILAAAYLTLLAMAMLGPGGFSLDFSNFDSIKAAFAKEEVMLIGWIHFLAFDLAVGMWELRDAQRRAMPHLWLVPCLVFTLMFGPVGFLLYMGIRTRYPLAH